MRNVHKKICILPLQGDVSTTYYFTQGVAIGLGYNGLSARKTIEKDEPKQPERLK
jgi:hypothetical protein